MKNNITDKKKRSIRCKRKFFLPHSIERKSLASYERRKLSFWSVARRNKNEKLYDLSGKLIICVKCNLFVVMERLKKLKTERAIFLFFSCTFHKHILFIQFPYAHLQCFTMAWTYFVSPEAKWNIWWLLKMLIKSPRLKIVVRLRAFFRSLKPLLADGGEKVSWNRL